MTINNGKIEITDSEKEMFKKMGCVGIMAFEGNRVIFISEAESNEQAETSYVIYHIGNINNKAKRSRLYDNAESTKFLVNGKRYDYYNDIQWLQ